MVQSPTWWHGSKPTEVAEVKRLMIVADNSFAAQSIRLALRQTSGFQVVGFVDAAAPIHRGIADLRPDFVVVDDTQEPEQAIKRLEDLSEMLPSAKIVLLTMRMDDAVISLAFDAGAHAVIAKTVHPVSLATLLREIARDTIVHRPRPQTEITNADCPLTDRELEILRLVAEGYTNG